MALSDAILTRLLDAASEDHRPQPRAHGTASGDRLAIRSAKLPPVIHVAGTNGKGSTVSYLRHIMEAAGLVVHAYTSPHLVRFHERIRVAGALISEADLTALLEECEVGQWR